MDLDSRVPQGHVVAVDSPARRVPPASLVALVVLDQEGLLDSPDLRATQDSLVDPVDQDPLVSSGLNSVVSPHLDTWFTMQLIACTVDSDETEFRLLVVLLVVRREKMLKGKLLLQVGHALSEQMKLSKNVWIHEVSN